MSGCVLGCEGAALSILGCDSLLAASAFSDILKIKLIQDRLKCPEFGIMGGFRGGLCPGRHLSGRGGLSVAVASGEDFREKGSLYVNSKLLKFYYMLHLDVGGGGICPVGFSGEGLFIRYFGV